MGQKLVIAAIVVFCMFVVYLLIQQSNDCELSGGILVRTAFDYVCIKR